MSARPKPTKWRPTRALIMSRRLRGSADIDGYDGCSALLTHPLLTPRRLRHTHAMHEARLHALTLARAVASLLQARGPASQSVQSALVASLGARANPETSSFSLTDAPAASSSCQPTYPEGGRVKCAKLKPKAAARLDGREIAVLCSIVQLAARDKICKRHPDGRSNQSKLDGLDSAAPAARTSAMVRRPTLSNPRIRRGCTLRLTRKSSRLATSQICRLRSPFCFPGLFTRVQTAPPQAEGNFHGGETCDRQ